MLYISGTRIQVCIKDLSGLTGFGKLSMLTSQKQAVFDKMLWSRWWQWISSAFIKCFEEESGLNVLNTCYTYPERCLFCLWNSGRTDPSTQQVDWNMPLILFLVHIKLQNCVKQENCFLICIINWYVKKVLQGEFILLSFYKISSLL